MNIENLQLINKNSTSRIIFNLLATSRTISNETNIESFKAFLKKRGFAINDQEFYQVFDELEQHDVGYFSSVRPSMFVWKFHLKDISEQIMYPNKKIEIREENAKPDLKLVEKEESSVYKESKTPTANKTKPKGRGRPPGAKNKPKPQQVEVFQSRRPVPSQTTRATPQEKSSIPNAPKDVMFCFTTERGKVVTLSLNDADNLIKQIEYMREEL